MKSCKQCSLLVHIILKRKHLYLIFGGELIVTSCGNVTNVYFVVVLVAFFLIVLLNEQGED